MRPQIYIIEKRSDLRLQRLRRESRDNVRRPMMDDAEVRARRRRRAARCSATTARSSTASRCCRAPPPTGKVRVGTELAAAMERLGRALPRAGGSKRDRARDHQELPQAVPAVPPRQERGHDRAPADLARERGALRRRAACRADRSRLGAVGRPCGSTAAAAAAERRRAAAAAAAAAAGAPRVGQGERGRRRRRLRRRPRRRVWRRGTRCPWRRPARRSASASPRSATRRSRSVGAAARATARPTIRSSLSSSGA